MMRRLGFLAISSALVALAMRAAASADDGGTGSTPAQVDAGVAAALPAADGGVPVGVATSAAGARPPGAAEAPAGAVDVTVAKENDCDNRLVLCIDPQGKPFHDNLIVYGVGEKLVVRVIGVYQPDLLYTISAQGTSAESRLVNTKTLREAGSIKLVEDMFEVPNADSLTIFVKITNVANGSVETNIISLGINHGKYFARPGLSFTWVEEGARTITATHDVVTKSSFIPGVSLTFWPWGHRADALSFLTGPAYCNVGDSRRWCITKFVFRHLGDFVGFQIGTDLDLTNPFDTAFFGVTLEPISGLGFSGGVAITNGQYFSGAPIETTDAIIERKSAHGYFSLTLTLELYDSVVKLAGKRKDEPTREP